MALAVGFWALLAWQTHRLWTRLFPERADLSWIAATMAFAPLLVRTQFTTVTTLFPVNLPVTLVLAGLLWLLREEGDGALRDWSLAASLTAAAVLISEYGVAAAAASAALLLGLRRPRSAAAVALGAAAGYVAFRLFADIGSRPKLDAAGRIAEFVGHPWSALSLWLSGLWYTLLGAYGETISEIHFDEDSPSTWIAVFAGALIALGAALTLRSEPGEPRPPARRFAALLLAVGAGLAVVVLSDSSPVSLDPYRSRYRLPVVPFAVVATLGALDRIVGRRFRKLVLPSLAFLAGWRMVDGAFQARREQEIMDGIGRRLLPLVRHSEGIVIGVIPDQGMRSSSDITPKVTRRWTDADSRRVLVLPDAEATDLIGTRFGCQSPDHVHLNLKRNSAVRSGEISRLVWVSVHNGRAGAAETYCLPRGL